MQWTQVITALFVGVGVSTLSLLITSISLRSVKKVYHTKHKSQVSIIVWLVYLLTSISVFVMISRSSCAACLIRELVTLAIMSMIAYWDLFERRIPIVFLLAALIAGIYFSMQANLLSLSLIGGVSNLCLALIIHWFGDKYSQLRSKSHKVQSAFGLGDVSAAGSLGFLLAFPASLLGFLIALVIVVFYALGQSLIMRRNFLDTYTYLGPGFFFATLVLLLFY